MVTDAECRPCPRGTAPRPFIVDDRGNPQHRRARHSLRPGADGGGRRDVPASWPRWRGASFCSPPSSIDARRGAPRAPPRSRPGWPSAAVSPSRRRGRGRTSASGSSTCPSSPTGLTRARSPSTGTRRGRRRHTRDRRRARGAGVGVLGAPAGRAGPDGTWPSETRAQSDYDARAVRFNDACRTVSAQLPAESYAEVRAGLEARARDLPNDGETSWDQRLADAFVSFVCGSGGRAPHVVVAHVPFETLLDRGNRPGRGARAWRSWSTPRSSGAGL